jgi:hypothetical protein
MGIQRSYAIELSKLHLVFFHHLVEVHLGPGQHLVVLEACPGARLVEEVAQIDAEERGGVVRIPVSLSYEYPASQGV